MRKLLSLLGACLSTFALALPFQEMEAFMPLGQNPALINGTIADRTLYPATIWIGNCTASVIGPRTVWTAAHCTGNTRISFTVGTARYSAECLRDQNYLRGNTTADYSLCYTDREVIDIPYENINIDPTHVKRGDWVLQSGFGCTRWGRQLDGQLRVGKAQILRMPSGTNNDYVTGNGSVLCSGDSGGPAWSLNEDGSRNLLISTNSRSNTTTQSYLSAIATQQGLAFLRRYQDRYKTGICGVDQRTGCRRNRQLEPQEFAMEQHGVSLKVVVQPTAKYSVEDAQFALQAALNSLGEK